VVHAERSAAQPRQVGGSDRWNVISAETSATSHPICDIAGVNLPVSEQMKVLGVILDRRLTFEKHATAVAKSCNYHAQAICHIRHLLTPELAQTLACSLILSRIDYCNALLYGAPTSTIQKLQRVQNNTDQIVLQMPRWSHVRPLLHSLHWLPVDQRIIYEMPMVTFKFSALQRQPISADTYSPASVFVYGHQTLLSCVNLHQNSPGFRYSARAVWN